MNSRRPFDPLRECSSRGGTPGHEAARPAWTRADVLERAVPRGATESSPVPAGPRFGRVRNGGAPGRLRRFSPEPDALSGDRACPDSVHAAGSMAGRREGHGRSCGDCLPHGGDVRVGRPSRRSFLHGRRHRLFPQCRVRHSRIGCFHHSHPARGCASSDVGSEERRDACPLPRLEARTGARAGRDTPPARISRSCRVPQGRRRRPQEENTPKRIVPDAQTLENAPRSPGRIILTGDLAHNFHLQEFV